MVRLVLFVLLLEALIFGVSDHSLFAGEPFWGLAVPHLVKAEDGAGVYVFEIKQSTESRNAPVVLLEPGLLETAEALENFAVQFYREGFRVFVGQVRLAGRVPYVSGAAKHNGLEEVVYYDFPAHLRKVLSIVDAQDGGPYAKVHLVGHSMGGIEILGSLSNDRLSEEFESRIAAATILGSPHDLQEIPLAIRMQATLLTGVLKFVRHALGAKTLGLHRSFFDLTNELKSKGPLRAAIARRAEDQFIEIANRILHLILIDVDQTSEAELRRLWFEKLSAVPLDLLIDFAEMATHSRLENRAGKPLIVPEKIRIPLQIVRGDQDHLAKWNTKKSLFTRLKSEAKRLVSIYGMKHVSLILSDQLEIPFLPTVVEFHASDPKEVAAIRPEIHLSARASCESALVQDSPVPAIKPTNDSD